MPRRIRTTGSGVSSGRTMAYFVTGGTGFIGRFLVARLFARGEPIYVLTRKSSLEKLAALRDSLGATDRQIVAVSGDLEKPALGVSDAEIRKLKGKVDHFFHLAAIYDLGATAEAQQEGNVNGTRHAVEFAERIAAGCFHHTSS